jgi:hypothetical protein
VGAPGPDADASGADALVAGGEDPDSPAPLEEGPDVDLNANGGDPLDDDDEEDDDLDDPAATDLG